MMEIKKPELFCEIKKPLDKLQAAVYNISVKRLCIKRLPSNALKNNRTHFGNYGRLFFLCFEKGKVHGGLKTGKQWVGTGPTRTKPRFILMFCKRLSSPGGYEPMPVQSWILDVRKISIIYYLLSFI